MSNVAHIGEARGSFLMTVDFYRRPDGSISAILQDMPDHVIEGEESITARFAKAGEWAREGSLDLMRQGIRFGPEGHGGEASTTIEGEEK